MTQVRTAKYFKSLPHEQEMLGMPIGDMRLPNGSEPAAKRLKA